MPRKNAATEQYSRMGNRGGPSRSACTGQLHSRPAASQTKRSAQSQWPPAWILVGPWYLGLYGAHGTRPAWPRRGTYASQCVARASPWTVRNGATRCGGRVNFQCTDHRDVIPGTNGLWSVGRTPGRPSAPKGSLRIPGTRRPSNPSTPRQPLRKPGMRQRGWHWIATFLLTMSMDQNWLPAEGDNEHDEKLA